MGQADYKAFFDGYAAAYTRSLGERVEVEAIRAAFADHFIAAGPAGVAPGANDESFAAGLVKAYEFYRSIGTRRMAVRAVHPTAIDEAHDLVAVDYRADYVRKDGTEVTIDFTVTYALAVTPAGPKIFAFIAGDEMALYRQYGLVD